MTKIPYTGTTVPAERTQAQIQKMLYDHGVKGTQWTDIGDQTVLKFIITVEGRPLTVKVSPPMLRVTKRERGRYGRLVNSYDRNVSFRVLWWWLKSKLEAIDTGLVSFEQEFLPYITGVLPSGEETTIGELVIPKLAALPQGDLSRLAKALPEGD